MWGCLPGLAGAALAAAVVGNTIRRTVAFAAAVGSTPALVAVVQVARMPSHGHPAAAEALFAAKVRSSWCVCARWGRQVLRTNQQGYPLSPLSTRSHESTRSQFCADI